MSSSSQRDFGGTERFSVERCLGAGAFGVVYQAFDRERNTRLALKSLRQADAAALYRFKREFRALADLSHRNLVTLYELLSDGEQWFFTMELVEGVSFLDYVREDLRVGSLDDSSPTMPAVDMEKRREATEIQESRDSEAQSQSPDALSGLPPGPDSLERLRAALRQLAEGVSALHEAGILHCDIKPSNVLVTGEGRVVLLDFGLVTELAPQEYRQSFHIVGTPAYMSPEQAAGLAVSEATDWYSVGVMVYEALSGRLPFPGRSLEALMDKQRMEPPAPSKLVPEVPEDLNALCQGLLRRDARKRPSGPEVLHRLKGIPVMTPRSVPALPSPKRMRVFVGRDPHLAALSKAFEAAKQGRAVTVYVHGGSGMGKTALVRQFLERLHQVEKGVVVLAGRCYERESVPYKALDSLVDELSLYLKRLPTPSVEALLPRDVLALARLFPVLGRVEAVAGARQRVIEIPDSQELRRRAFGGLRELLARLSDRKPLVLFIDDLQWGDVDSAALLAELMAPPDPPSLLLIGCYRSEEAATSPLLRKLLPLRGTPNWTPHVYELVVGELAPEEARDLARALLGEEQPASMARAHVIARESAGSPFFIDELVQYSQAAGELAEGEGAMTQPSADTQMGEVTLDKVIQARVSRLSEEAQRLLAVVAVAGQPLEVSAAKRAAQIETEERKALAILRAGHLIRSRGTEEREEIETYHDRIRETVVAQLSPGRLKAYHHGLARALEAASRVDPETLAIHFHAGGDPETAAEHAAVAAAQASEALAFDRAARLYQVALDLRTAEGAERRALRVKLGDALANAGRGAEAAQAYLSAVGGATAAEAIELQRRAAQQLLISGHVDEGLRVARTVLGTIGIMLAETPRRALLSLLFRRAQIRLRGLSFREREASQVSPEELFRIDTCWSVAEGLAVVDTIRGADIQTCHLLLALRAGEPYRIARALALEAAYCSTSGGRSRHRTEKLIQASTRLAERVNHPHALGLVALVAGTAAFLQGRFKKAHELSERAEEILRERCTGVAWERFNAQFFSIAPLFWLGELKELSCRLPAVLKDAWDRGDLYAVTQLRTSRAQLAAAYLAADEPDKAREEVRRAMEGWSRQGFHIQHLEEMQVQVDIALYCGKGELAWKLISEQWPALKRSLLLRVQNILIESLASRASSALAAAASGVEPNSLLRVAERDARGIEREKMAWGDPLARLIRAGVAATRGHGEAAVTLLASAEKGFEAADMSLHAAAARRRRGELIGREGRALIEAADSWMIGQKIRNPARMTAMLAPGRWTSSSEGREESSGPQVGSVTL